MATVEEKLTLLQQANSELVSAVNIQTQEVLDKMGQINTLVAAKLQEVDTRLGNALSDLTVLGDGSIGSTVINAASVFSPVGGEAYIHLRLPFKTDTDAQMFHLHVRGYLYASAEVLDTTLVGYCYRVENALLNTQATGTHTADFYTTADNTVCCSIPLPSGYYATAVVDTTRVGAGRLIKRGEIEMSITSEPRLV